MNDQDFLDIVTKGESKLRLGRDISPSEAVTNFAAADPETRIQFLTKIRREPGEDITDMRAAAERNVFERKLKSVHERLRRIGR